MAMNNHPYTNNEYANMCLLYGETRGNALAAARLYQERYPNLRHPNNVTIQGINFIFNKSVRKTSIFQTVFQVKKFIFHTVCGKSVRKVIFRSLCRLIFFFFITIINFFE